MPPENSKVTGHEIDDLQALIAPGTRLYALTNRLISDLESLMSAAQPSSANAAYSRYLSDLTQIQHYCLR